MSAEPDIPSRVLTLAKACRDAGGRAWLVVYLDGPVYWQVVADLITDAYRQNAPKRLLARLDV